MHTRGALGRSLTGWTRPFGRREHVYNLPRRILLPAQRLGFGHQLRSGHIRARGRAGRGVPAVCRGLLLPEYNHGRGVRPWVLLPTRIRVLYSLPRGQLLPVQGRINAH